MSSLPESVEAEPMPDAVKVSEGIYWLGVNDRQTRLFEELWPLPNGVSYNAYLVEGTERCALIDTVKGSFSADYRERVAQWVSAGRRIEYLVINHMEPDHSGSIKTLVELCPGIRLVGNEHTVRMIEDFYRLGADTVEVGDGDEIDLGGRKLVFRLTPMVHWPETMMTFDSRTGTLFSGDAFGGFGTLDGGIFDDEVNIEFYQDEIRRYFTNIVGRFSAMVVKAIDKVRDLPIAVVAPTHGPIWRRDPSRIIEAYASWSRHETEPGVVVYGSMYGNTERMADAAARVLSERGLKNIKIFNASHTHVSYMINEIWRFRGLLLGSCTYNLGLFPPMIELLDKLRNSNLRGWLVGIFGTYAWSGGGVKRLRECAQECGWKLVEPVVEARCAPKPEDLRGCRELAVNLAAALDAPGDGGG